MNERTMISRLIPVSISHSVLLTHRRTKRMKDKYHSIKASNHSFPNHRPLLAQNPPKNTTSNKIQNVGCHGFSPSVTSRRPSAKRLEYGALQRSLAPLAQAQPGGNSAREGKADCSQICRPDHKSHYAEFQSRPGSLMLGRSVQKSTRRFRRKHPGLN